MKLAAFKILTNENSKKGFTLNQIMATVGLAGVLTLVGFNGYQRAIQTTNEVAVEQEARHVHQLMEEIFTNQNPNEYPPQDTFTTGVSGWASPANFQAATEIDQIIHRWRTGGRGSVIVGYHNPAPEGYKLVIHGDDYHITITPVGSARDKGSACTHVGEGCEEDTAQEMGLI